ncbi:MAG: hypothetical protein HOQ22_19510, partial [Nocardioidaceae bacterium]|nr:hypothetical protein [Nocardioidaceae bacterium]
AGALVTDDPRVVLDALAWADTVLGHRDAPPDTPGALRSALAEALRDLPVASRMLAGTPEPV